MSDVFLDTKQLAEFLGISTSTAEAWRYRGGGPPYIKLAVGGRRGGLIRYARAAVEAWLAAQARGAVPTP